MQETLQDKLYQYLQSNNPDILIQLQEDDALSDYLIEKVAGVLKETLELKNQLSPLVFENVCMEMLTSDLNPSKYNYIINLLEEEFEAKYNELIESGLLKTEAINLIGCCQSTFTDLNFSEENEDNQFIRYAIMGAIQEYFESVADANENVSNELQQPAKTEG